MSSPQESSTSSAFRPSRLGCLLGLFAIPLFLFLLMMAGIGTGLIELGFTLLFGWVSFLSDTWPRISWNWSAVLTGLLCIGLVLLLAHLFLAWLCRSIASNRGKTFSWPWKWTWCGLIGVGLCFLVGMAVAGAAHQIGWIAENEEPLFEDKFLERFRGQIACRTIAGCLKPDSTVDSVRADVAAIIKGIEGRPSSQWPNMQSLHVLLLIDPDAKVEGVLVFPRNAERRLRFGGDYQGPSDRLRISHPDLMEFVRTNEARLVAF